MKLTQSIKGWWRALRVAQQLALSFGVLLALFAVGGAVSLVGLSRVAATAQTVSEVHVPALGHLYGARVALLSVREFEVKHSRTTDKSYFSEYEEKIAEGHKVMSSAQASLPPSEGEAETKLRENLKKALSEYDAAKKKVIDLGRQGSQMDAADISDGLGSTAFDGALAATDALIKYFFDAASADGARAAEVHARTRMTIGAMVGASLLVGIFLTWSIIRSLFAQLGGEPRDAVRAARAAAQGDLSSQIQLSHSSSDSLLANLREMQTSLTRIVSMVRENAESVATASAQIAQGNQDLSGRTEQQASALQETAATMHELGSMVRHNAESAQTADQMARNASDLASKGGAVVTQVVQTMRGISDASRKIAEIIGVIDGIAFQTNILALNAAVEAARAGEQGRGFAVVAAEVRSLAQRSASAAREIKTLIGTSVERVEQGTALVDQAGHTMEDIVTAIRQVTTVVAEISQASAQQNSGVRQVGEAISQMDQATQQNAALVEESAAAAESLKAQAGQLVEAVSVFRLAR